MKYKTENTQLCNIHQISYNIKTSGVPPIEADRAAAMGPMGQGCLKAEYPTWSIVGKASNIHPSNIMNLP